MSDQLRSMTWETIKHKLLRFVPSVSTVLLTLILLVNLLTFSIVSYQLVSEKHDNNEHISVLAMMVSLDLLKRQCNTPQIVHGGLLKAAQTTIVLELYSPGRYKEVFDRITMVENAYAAGLLLMPAECVKELDYINELILVVVRKHEILKYKYLQEVRE